MAGSTEGTTGDTLSYLAPVQIAKKKAVVLDSNINWHPHVETADHLVRDLESSRVLGIGVKINGAHITHGSRVLFLYFGKIYSAIIEEGNEWRGISRWEPEDVEYQDGDAVHVHFHRSGGDTTYIYTKDGWRKRKRKQG